MTKNILMVVTNFSDINDEVKTGVNMEEFSVPYLTFVATGYNVVVASPKGGLAPLDFDSLSCSNPMEWDDAAKFLRDTTKLSEVDVESFDAIFLVGGGGAMFDFPLSDDLTKIVEKMYRCNKIIAAVCHGVVGLVNAVDENGEPIVNNKHITSFTNKEEHIKKMVEFMPFSLENKLRELGAEFIEDKPWREHVEISCNIVTGQNNHSALLTAEGVISLL